LGKIRAVTPAKKLVCHHPGASPYKKDIEGIIDQAGSISESAIARMLYDNQGGLVHIGRKT